MLASRATELVKGFPEHVVTEWMGHSKRIAQKPYLKVTEEDDKQTSSNPTQQITSQLIDRWDEMSEEERLAVQDIID